MPTTFSSLLTVPFLALISIPLVFSAYITIFLSVLTLFLRLSVIYVELCYAIILNYFVIPTSNNSSLLNFASEPTTPASATPKRQSIDHGGTVALPHPGNQRQRAPLFRGQSRPAPVRRRNSSNSSNGPHDGDCSRPAHKEDRRRNAPTTPPAALLSLISGDEGRDFEGVGGWRCPPSRSASSSSKHSMSDEADERAWLSLNNRLELPSQPFSLLNLDPDTLPWRHRQAGSGSPDGRAAAHAHGHRHGHGHTQRHHHRSATTSLIPPSSPSLPRSNRSRAISPRPQSQQRAISIHSDFFRMMAGAPQSQSHLSAPSEALAGQCHFASRPVIARANSSGSTTSTSGTTTPVEDRPTARSVGRFMAHYPTGVRYRRQSMSGPNSGPLPLGRDQTF